MIFFLIILMTTTSMDLALLSGFEKVTLCWLRFKRILRLTTTVIMLVSIV